MSDTGWLYPTYAYTILNGTNPENIKADDGNEASVVYNKESGVYGTIAGTSVFTSSELPVGCTVVGIECVAERRRQSTEAHDSYVYLIKGTSYSDIEVYRAQNKASAASWGEGTSVGTYGGATDMWGTSITRATLLETPHGFYVTGGSSDGTPADIFFDYLKIKVYYTGGTPSVVPQMLVCM
jgi:hypothetical protein